MVECEKKTVQHIPFSPDKWTWESIMFDWKSSRLFQKNRKKTKNIHMDACGHRSMNIERAHTNNTPSAVRRTLISYWIKSWWQGTETKEKILWLTCWAQWFVEFMFSFFLLFTIAEMRNGYWRANVWKTSKHALSSAFYRLCTAGLGAECWCHTLCVIDDDFKRAKRAHYKYRKWKGLLCINRRDSSIE